ncbi:conserved hypothetical protein [Xenorhabdus bovienii str. puntauvense]|uniref:Uncharacterized protein n=1 Tax=Xenorhabdus bovienii str. puntauvense TaxID=1398201 RepID=A0A077N7V9_XENBV|nr:conserved hypothetical protein [Xenorhabdus bovienii str. puntauvense]
MSNDIDGIMETFKGVSAQGHRLELAQKPGSLPEVPLMRQNHYACVLISANSTMFIYPDLTGW